MPPSLPPRNIVEQFARKTTGLFGLLHGLWRLRAPSGQSLLSLLQRYRRFHWATGASPTEFFAYRLWDTSIPMARRALFLTWAQRRPLEAYMNPKREAGLVQSKLRSDLLFREVDIPTPDLLGVWCPRGAVVEHATAVHTQDSLGTLLRTTTGGVVCKREFGGSGEFVLVFREVKGDHLLHASGEWWSLDRLIAAMAGTQPWLVQQRVGSHPDLVQLIGSDELASIRLATCRRKDGSTFLLQAMLKLPSTGTGLDNMSAGNVAVAVDDDGVMGEAIAGMYGPPVTVHPVSGLTIKGRQVPCWHEAKSLVLGSHARIPALTSLGWDVAIGPDGPLVLETNAWWGAATQQPGLRGLLTPDFLEYVEERGASHLLKLDRRRQLCADQPEASRPAKFITSP